MREVSKTSIHFHKETEVRYIFMSRQNALKLYSSRVEIKSQFNVENFFVEDTRPVLGGGAFDRNGGTLRHVRLKMSVHFLIKKYASSSQNMEVGFYYNSSNVAPYQYTHHNCPIYDECQTQ